VTRRFVQEKFTIQSAADPDEESLYRKVLETEGEERGVAKGKSSHEKTTQLVCCDIVDTPGPTRQYTEYAKEEFSRFLSRNALIGIHGYLLVYDITSRESFTIIQTLNEVVLRYHGDSPVPRVLLGGKLDLCAQRQVGKGEGRALARTLGIPFLEISAKHNVDVERAFRMLLEEVERGEAGEGKGKWSLLGGEEEEQAFLGCRHERERSWEYDGYGYCVVS